MVKVFKKIDFKNSLICIGIFFMFLVWNLIFVPLNLDEVWNYGFAHNVYMGLVPYKDFNMILTPFYPFIMSIGFHLFGSNMLVFHIEQAIILTAVCYLLFKLLKDKAWYVLMFLFFPLPVSFPSYNLFLFFILLVLIYFEEKDGNDYLIGFILALGVLTKQSVGVCFVLVSLYYIKDKKRLLRRFLGFMIPMFMFMFYLMFNNCLYQFLDLCLFGLFDFAADNGNGISLYLILFLAVLCFSLYHIFKDRKNIRNYYILAFYSVFIPLFDTYHFQVMFLGFLLLILNKIRFLSKIKGSLFVGGVIIGLFLVSGIFAYKGGGVYPNDINHFEYRRLDKFTINFTKEVNGFLEKNKEANFIFANANGYYFRIVNDMPIGYLDLINMGNWGYNGSKKLMDGVKKVENPIFIVDESELSNVKQTDKQILNYVLDNGKKIKSIGFYDIYIIE